VLGTGASQQFPDPRVLRALYERGVGVEVMDTSAPAARSTCWWPKGAPSLAALIV
jgi:uncharacterized protein